MVVVYVVFPFIILNSIQWQDVLQTKRYKNPWCQMIPPGKLLLLIYVLEKMFSFSLQPMFLVLRKLFLPLTLSPRFVYIYLVSIVNTRGTAKCHPVLLLGIPLNVVTFSFMGLPHSYKGKERVMEEEKGRRVNEVSLFQTLTIFLNNTKGTSFIRIKRKLIKTTSISTWRYLLSLSEGTVFFFFLGRIKLQEL